MTGYSDDPFQMDEEMNDASRKDCSSEIKNAEVSFGTIRDDSSDKGQYAKIEQHNFMPQYEEIREDAFMEDRESIRTRLTEFQLDRDAKENGQEKDTENEFDEDADDKLERNTNSMENFKSQGQEPNELTPPENFAPIINNIYRSSFPQPQNFQFLRELKLKSVLCLIPEEYPEPQKQFLVENDIELFQLGMSGNKEPFVKISSELITEAIKIALNPANHPILIHCNRGKHRTGCLVGVIRRLQQWSMSIIFDEYRKFAAPKERPMDQQFIELYDRNEVTKYCIEHNYLPLRWD